MADAVSDELLAALTPVFPQFQCEGLISVINLVRNDFRLENGNNEGVVANLLPLCIDFLLTTPHEAIEPRNEINQNTGNIGSTVIQQNRHSIEPSVQKITKNRNLHSESSSSSSGSSNDSSSSDSSDSLNSNNSFNGSKRMTFNMERQRSKSDSSNSSTSSESSTSENSLNSILVDDLEESLIKNKRRSSGKSPFRNDDFSDEVIFVKENKQSVAIFENEARSTPRPSQVNLILPISSNRAMNENNISNQNPDGLIKNAATYHTVLSIEPGPSTSVPPMSSISKENEENKKNVYQIALEQVLMVVQDVDKNFALNLIMQNFGSANTDLLANNVVEQLFGMSYPKSKKKDEEKLAEESKKQETDESSINYYDMKSLPYIQNTPDYEEQCINLLQQKFNRISTKDLRHALAKNQWHYAPTVKFIQNQLQFHFSGKDPPSPFKKMSFLKMPRKTTRVPFEIRNKLLKKEVQFVANKEREKNEEEDHTFALELNAKEYEEQGQLIECGCCFGEAAFEDMAQCIEGHLFCAECLNNYAKEAIFGGAKVQLACMTDGCDSSFPLSQLKKKLPKTMIDKYQERLQDESLKMVHLPDLVRCPSCDFAAEIPETEKVFRCMNEKCKKETCRYCQVEWKEHFGIPCNELEKKDETNLRTTYEEKMSEAKIRTCVKCKCGFMKTDGCNKMTCRCGTTMCYICRESKIGYNHFCTHARDPGHSCEQCKRCSLWTNTEEDDERAIKELREEAKKKSEKLNAEASNSMIGVKRPLLVGPQDEQRHAKKKKHRKTS